MVDNRYIGAILAGGKGTRMAPFSERMPKPLLPVANKPLFQFQIETYIECVRVPVKSSRTEHYLDVQLNVKSLAGFDAALDVAE